MKLPGHLDSMIARVAEANRNTVVVVQSGMPMEMPWVDEVASVVQAWYGGNETGNAIADILYGDANPSGKLSVSFPKHLEDNPTFLNFRSERGRVLYGEDIYIGYRYYEALRKQVLFPFGHGLSYTTFKSSSLFIAQDETSGTITAMFAIKNTGELAGAEVAQVYVSQQSPSISRPRKELKGYKKVFLQPGEEKKVSITMETKYAASFWEEETNSWIIEKDTYNVVVANSSLLNGKELKGSFNISKISWWSGL
jgi:beta-glucosidase